MSCNTGGFYSDRMMMYLTTRFQITGGLSLFGVKGIVYPSLANYSMKILIAQVVTLMASISVEEACIYYLYCGELF